MSDWEQFLDEVPWIRRDETVVVGEAQPWNRGPIQGLPVLSSLLESATITRVSVAGEPHELLAWGPRTDRRGWLCRPPRRHVSDEVHPLHRVFWSVCGGITEWMGEPGYWWQAQECVLTVSAARTDPAEVLDACRWLWEDAGLAMPIKPADYYPAAVEANGNLTLVHRQNGQILLLAPDHAFDGVTPLPGCPPYSLYTIDDVPDLASWIETSAAAQQR